jgi:hypothetical protein
MVTFAEFFAVIICGILLAIPGAILGLITLAREDDPTRTTGMIGSCLNVLILVGWLALGCGGAIGVRWTAGPRSPPPPSHDAADFFP